MKDMCGRDIHYLRLSVTDKCNLRCRYCMPDGIEKCSHDDILSYEEMLRIIKITATLGIDTVRITGGEPLIRKDIEQFIYKIKQIPEIKNIYMTTNGVLLADKLDELILAGLDSVNISLDTLDKERFFKITGFRKFSDVERAIKLTCDKGIPVKINCVPQMGINDDELPKIASIAKDRDIEVRFIEMMPVGEGKGMAGVDNRELLGRLKKHFGNMMPVDGRVGAGPAECYRPEGFKGSIGFISAMHGKFCKNCNRIRVTSKGYMKGCLASDQGADLREMLRDGASDIVIRQHIVDTIFHKPYEHHFEKPDEITENNGMYMIGG